jgi:hypothetical protein
MVSNQAAGQVNAHDDWCSHAANNLPNCNLAFAWKKSTCTHFVFEQQRWDWNDMQKTKGLQPCLGSNGGRGSPAWTATQQLPGARSKCSPGVELKLPPFRSSLPLESWLDLRIREGLTSHHNSKHTVGHGGAIHLLGGDCLQHLRRRQPPWRVDLIRWWWLMVSREFLLTLG